MLSNVGHQHKLPGVFLADSGERFHSVRRPLPVFQNSIHVENCWSKLSKLHCTVVQTTFSTFELTVCDEGVRVCSVIKSESNFDLLLLIPPHISQIFSSIIQPWLLTKQGHSLWGCSCVYVSKSMMVNGRNPSANAHLSSWITDMINRRYSSISPVFPIQSCEAGLFPSLSADLVTFTKLLDAHAGVFGRLRGRRVCSSSVIYASLISLFLCCFFQSEVESLRWEPCSSTAFHREAVQQFAPAPNQEGEMRGKWG